MTRHGAHSASRLRAASSAREVGGDVDVEAERRVAHDAHLEAAAARPRRRGGRHEPGPYANANGDGGREREHRRAVVAVIGDERPRPARSPSSATPSSDRREREVGVHDDDRGEPVRAHPRAAGVGGARRAIPGSSTYGDAERARPRDDLGRARHDDDRPGARGVRRRARPSSRASARARVVVERVGEARLAERERPQRDDDACTA